MKVRIIDVGQSGIDGQRFGSRNIHVALLFVLPFSRRCGDKPIS